MPPPAQLAKAALRRLLTERQEPTPENYARAYRQEAGDAGVGAALPERALRLVERLSARAFDADTAGTVSAAMAQGCWDQAESALESAGGADAAALSGLIQRIVDGAARSGRHWTAGRRRDSLQRVLGGSRSDPRKLQQRLSQLVQSWETDSPDSAVEADAGSDGEAAVGRGNTAFSALAGAGSDAGSKAGSEAGADAVEAASPVWQRVVGGLGGTVQQALPADDGRHRELTQAFASLTARINADGATPPLADELEALCLRAERVLQHRHHLVDQLGLLCGELTSSLTELAENDSWAKGQCDAMRVKLEEGLSARGVRSVSDLLRTTRERQGLLRVERERARDAFKVLITSVLSELGELGTQTGRFHESVGRYADVIEKADSLDALSGIVREMVEESRSVQLQVQQSHVRLQSEQGRATELTQRVDALEGELRRLSEEVSTDQLTQIANRRGLLLAFDAERARLQRDGSSLAVGLLDIDNFKRLNDDLGHSVGDVALKALAQRVAGTLRPTDRVARYGGEEFVVLLPDTPVDEAQQILTRLQRSLTNGLFLHENRQVFVTFSAGVTTYRADERLEDALERADQALYEAKRTGKNRTCLG